MKSNKFILHIVVALAFAISTASCSKYLDKKSDAKLIVPTSLSDLQAMLDYTQVMNQAVTPCFGEQSADDFFLPPAVFNSSPSLTIDLYTWKFVDQQNPNDWSFGYKPVYYANYCLEGLDKIPVTAQNSARWNNIKGSSLFYRSYFYLLLLWNYSKAYNPSTAGQDPGIALKATSDFNEPSVRASVEMSYQKVLDDALASLPFLPAHPQHVMRPSKEAAYGLLARTYLTMGKYREAALYADSCLQLNHQLMNYNGDGDITGNIKKTYPFKQFNKETIFYTEMRSNSFTRTDLTIRADTMVFASYADNDLRKWGLFSDTGRSGLNKDKYPTFKGSYTAGFLCFSGLATDEMYLIRAEGYVRTGQVQKGLDDLNTLLTLRWATNTYQPLVTDDATIALNTVLKERRKELFFRGLRWIDIKRLNIQGANIIIKRIGGGKTYELRPNAGVYALPLPADIIRITGMPQNSTE